MSYVADIFEHDVTQQELRTFAEDVLGKTGLTKKELNEVADLNALAWRAWVASRNYTLTHVIMAKQISMDVSTGDADAGNRIFGVVNGVQEDPDGFIILAEEDHRNFDQTRLELDAAIGGVVWKYIDRMLDHCDRDTPESIIEAFTKAVAPHIQASLKHVQRLSAKTAKKLKKSAQ